MKNSKAYSKTIQIARNRLIEAYNHLRAIYLFGSFAWGEPNNDSDMDFLIIVNHSKEKKYKRAVKGLRALRGLGIAKDIIVYTKEEFEQISKDTTSLCYKIKNEGLKLYETI
jgi:predicted nucleotidyltransferase